MGIKERLLEYNEDLLELFCLAFTGSMFALSYFHPESLAVIFDGISYGAVIAITVKMIWPKKKVE